MQVIEPELQVLVSLTERDDDGHLLQRHAVFGSEPAARLDVWVVLLDLLQAHGDVELHPQRTHWEHRERRGEDVPQTGCSCLTFDPSARRRGRKLQLRTQLRHGSILDAEETLRVPTLSETLKASLGTMVHTIIYTLIGQLKRPG